MKRLASISFFVFICSFVAFSQNNDPELKTLELLSPMNADGTQNSVAAKQSCFSFINEKSGCVNGDIYFGGLRAGNDWDWFQAMGVGDRNKIQFLEAKNWTDDFKVPDIEPYAKLKTGEQRLIVVDSSGKRGEPGKPGASGLPGNNADGTYSSTTINPSKNSNQTANQTAEKPQSTVTSGYQPYIKAVLGNMYVMRVVDENNDFYVLFRVDELERGKRCVISWKKFEVTKEK